MHHYTANALSIIALFFILFISSCEQYSNSGIEESVAFIESTTPIAEAQNVTMEVRDGYSQDVHFLIDLSNIQPNDEINDGRKKAWCIEWGQPVIREQQTDVKLHSTENQVYWNKLNLILNPIDSLKEKHADLTWKEIQIAIWEIVEYNPFDIEYIPEYSNFSRNFYEDNEYKFNVELAREIITSIKDHPDEVAGDKYAIIVENEGQILVTTND